MGKLQTLERVHHDDKIDNYYHGVHPNHEVVIDSARFQYLVDAEVEGQYQDYLITGKLPFEPGGDSDVEEELDDYYAYCQMYGAWFDEFFPRWCGHGNGRGIGACVICDKQAYEAQLEQLAGPAEPADLRLDPYQEEYEAHLRGQLRRLRRRGKTIARHRRHVARARERIFEVASPDNRDKQSEWLEEVTEKKPWQAPFRRFRRDPKDPRFDEWNIQKEKSRRARRMSFLFADELAREY